MPFRQCLDHVQDECVADDFEERCLSLLSVRVALTNITLLVAMNEQDAVVRSQNFEGNVSHFTDWLVTEINDRFAHHSLTIRLHSINCMSWSCQNADQLASVRHGRCPLDSIDGKQPGF